jgi:DNA-binding transcriptional regulator YiaG
MDKSYKSDIFKAFHEGAVAMYEVGGIDKDVMHEFDNDCLNPDTQNDVFSMQSDQARQNPQRSYYCLQ